MAIGNDTREKLGLLPTQKKLAEGDFTSFGIQKVKGLYCLVTIKFKDGNVDSVHKSELDNKAVALERFMIETSKMRLGGLE